MATIHSKNSPVSSFWNDAVLKEEKQNLVNALITAVNKNLPNNASLG
ncbi:hypothetical protein [Rickettsia amblyommatis]|uniref:Uncharacterized protein n=1 Tax=Rickettsia amblyommatis (strain GAT-30V) TaxID=1105111 RepID=H8K3A6_RICAG|nr:hypothetical protein [Rickettsia amblyommatis]AFC70298.1 hypothetical protein MCE_07620 [Rickettsia amblyommatis str. GAT-30V]KJV88822.1 hypothetical protein RAMDARK_1596 [Rickettsia amblyommatis str. Darkwater]